MPGNELSRRFRRQLVQDEFRAALTGSEAGYPCQAEAVVALSGNPVRDNSGRVINEASPENYARISLAAELANQIGSALVLNGETEQLPAMMQIADELGFPPERLYIVDSGSRGKSNTKTQIEVLGQDARLNNVKSLILVTSDYHAPRVRRTALANLSPEVRFQVVPVSQEKNHHEVFCVVRGEIRRIESYAARGDIALNLPR